MKLIVPLLLLATACAEEAAPPHVAQHLAHAAVIAGPALAEIQTDQALADAEDQQAAELRYHEREYRRTVANAEENERRQEASALVVREQVRTKADEVRAQRVAECHATYPDRLSRAKLDVIAMAPARTRAMQRCAIVTPHCALVGNLVACQGVTENDRRFFDAVCRDWPNVPAFDESEGCADVDPVRLDAYFGDKARLDLRRCEGDDEPPASPRPSHLGLEMAMKHERVRT